MKREWVVYGAYRGSKLEYIGKTGNLKSRVHQHRCRSKWARKCIFRVLQEAGSEAEAARIEAELIWLHQPPRNTYLKPAKPCANPMPREEAREIWFSSPTTVNWALLNEMPGWDTHRATHAFGPRPRMLIWRRPRVADGAYRINAKLYRVRFMMGLQ